MSIFSPRLSRFAGVGSCVALVVAVSVPSACGGGASTTCLRFSDCAQGMTCADGFCVVPPLPAMADAMTTEPTPDAGVETEGNPGATGNDSGSFFPTPGDGASGADASSVDGAGLSADAASE